jgi:hypothetical protein
MIADLWCLQLTEYIVLDVELVQGQGQGQGASHGKRALAEVQVSRGAAGLVGKDGAGVAAGRGAM